MNIQKQALCICLLASACLAQAQHARMTVKAEGGNLTYDVTFKGQPVVMGSDLGMNIDNRLLGSNVSDIREASTDGKYRTYAVRNADGGAYSLDTWEFDDGVAVRYRIPADGPRCVYSEQTSFNFPTGTHVWYASGPFQYGWLQAYQDRDISTIDGELLAPPATFHLPNGIYAAITEANLWDFHGAVLFGRKGCRVQVGYVENKGHVESGTITGIPQPKYWHAEVRDIPWIVSPARWDDKEIITPWRVLMLSDDLNGLVNNGILARVSDAPDPTLFPEGRDTEWIRPGRSVFTWLVEGPNRLSVANHKRYVDGMAEIGMQSVVVDDGWEQWPETEPDAKGRTKWDFLKELVDYARPKGIDIWVWRASSVRAGNKKDVGLVDPQEREAFMKKCAEVGVKGLKLDFFHTENRFTVQLMESLLREAAKNKLMVVFHGVNKPTGDSYTYPNLMAKEAVRGLECVGAENSWAPGPAWPYHNTVLPFTRWLAGPADYTPLNFRQFCPSSVSFTHQLAGIYMFTSPMLILAADMEDMLSCPARQFIEEVPVEWDETVVLPESSIGKFAALARRKGDTWYLIVMNGEAAFDGQVKLDFLPRGSYSMTIAEDKEGDYRQIAVNHAKAKAGQRLHLRLLPGGAYLAKIEKRK